MHTCMHVCARKVSIWYFGVPSFRATSTLSQCVLGSLRLHWMQSQVGLGAGSWARQNGHHGAGLLFRLSGGQRDTPAPQVYLSHIIPLHQCSTTLPLGSPRWSGSRGTVHFCYHWYSNIVFSTKLSIASVWMCVWNHGCLVAFALCKMFLINGLACISERSHPDHSFRSTVMNN